MRRGMCQINDAPPFCSVLFAKGTKEPNFFFSKQSQRFQKIFTFFSLPISSFSQSCIKMTTFSSISHFFLAYIKKKQYLCGEFKINNSMKQVHMGGYSIVIPENYVHRVKVSRVKGSRDVRLRLAKGEQSASVTGAFTVYHCWESDLH